MHRLFNNEQLIHEICSYVRRSQLPALARVSYTWFRCATSLLYKNISILKTLKHLLTLDGDGTPKLITSGLSDGKFKWFTRAYFSHVRTLKMNSDLADMTLLTICKSVSMGIPYLFPNIRHLKWEYIEYSPECTEVLIGLISPTIDQLSLSIENHRVLRRLCLLAVTRLSALRSVAIEDKSKTARASADLTEPSFVNPIQELLMFFTHTLTFVKISLSFNTSSVVECLSEMPNLHSLEIVGHKKKEHEKSVICGNGRGFISLRSLYFDGSFQSFRDMFLDPYGLTWLTTLSLSPKLDPANVGRFISAIAVACPHIKSLSFGERNSFDESTFTWPTVPWASIQPISSCKNLTSLSLHWMRVSVSLEELTEFLKSRTTWTHLHLITSIPLHLVNMIVYAKHCPNLQHLSMYVHEPGGFRVEDVPDDLPTFSNLTSIDFKFTHRSIMKSIAHPLGQLLCRICNKPPQLLGLSDQVTDDVLRNIAICYVDEQRTPMSNEVRQFVKEVLKKGTTA